MTAADLDFYRVVDAITPNFLRHLLEMEKSEPSQALSNWLS